MRLFKKSKNGLTYLMAVAMTAAPAFHIGDTIEIETLLNGRSDKKFLSDQESIRRFVKAQLPPGTKGEIEKIQQFKPSKGSKQGNTGLYIKVTSGPNAGKRYWVLYRPDRSYVKLYDKQSKETVSVQSAIKAETQRNLDAIQDREPASETAVAQDAVDLSQLVKSAGEAPQADCQNSEPSQPQGQPQQREVAIVQKKAAAPLSPEIASHYLRPTVQVQTNAPEIQELARRLTQNKPDDLSIAMAIHDWVAENIGYDTKAYFNEFQEKKPFTKSYDALSVLGSNDRVAICTGYANLTLALLRAANIPAREVEGLIHYTSAAPKTTCDQTDNNPEYHAWIETWVDGKWMPMDTTADAGTVDFKAQTFTRAPSQKYMDPDLFNATHSRCRVEEYY